MTEINWSKNVHFFPWKGERYKNALKNNRRLLLVGNSHYFRKDIPIEQGNRRDATNQEIQCAVNKGSDGLRAHHFFIRIQEFLAESLSYPGIAESNSVQEDPYQTVAFYNYLQVEYQEAREKRTSEHYRMSETGFDEILEKLKPNRVLVLGKETWSRMSEKNPKMTRVESNDWDPSDSSLYRIEMPCNCLLAHVIHPSYWKWPLKLSTSRKTLVSLLHFDV